MLREKLGKKALPYSFLRSSLLYRICKRYVDAYDNNNNGNIHSNGELYFLRKYINRSRLIFDVGANVGEWAEMALALNSAIDLHCFEPSSTSFSTLSKKSLAGNVTLNNFGLSSEVEDKSLFIFDDNSPLNSLWKRSGLKSYGLSTPCREEKVKLETLDNYCVAHKIEQIDVLKIDVEGHELEVLKGAKNLLSLEKINFIQFEYGGTYIDSKTFLKDVFEYFNEFNYSFYKIYPNKLFLINSYDVRFENFQYQNWAIIRKGIE
ncbi:FkbM family methyltransferase [Trichocoleus sp. FACHB-591]|uniref:FkbM family methyltransferase n=1 Tax=Trichocoleus sp. FACHB-591 TaxID=2692872 RepID=UPI001683B3F4|nr:FkbM family methyltransferase [Trichocoleus sp. FACHB-591]MBD2093913.1 FkbM family methyltransferase [Trichocoleus sp. FACHB-591]